MSTIKTKNLPSFDPFEVKGSLVTLADNYFENNNVDTYESGFLGYLIQALTFLTSDMLYQNSMAYNEAFLNRAILPSSVTEIANQLDYKIVKTIPAEGILTVIIPLPQENDLLVKIPVGSSVSANNIPYKVKNNYYIEKNNNGITIVAQNPENGLLTNIPYSLELRNKQLCLIFEITIWQIEVYYHDFVFENPSLYVFYEESVSGYDGQIYKVLVNADQELYTELSSIYQAKPNDRAYELKIDNITPLLTVKFGNGIYGYQPKTGVEAAIVVYTTLGSSGNIIPYAAKLTERLVNNITGNVLTVESYNPFNISNGSDNESIEDIKRHTIENISAAKRLVTETDYNGFQGVTGLTNLKAIPVLKKRDVIGNHIDVYSILFDAENKPIPTATVPYQIPNIIDSDYTVIKQGQEIVYDTSVYKSPFQVKIDTSYDIPMTKYFYSLNNLVISPTLFSKTGGEDILMGLRQIQSKIFDKDEQIVFICEVYKLSTMDANKIKAILKIQGLPDIPLNFIQAYDDKTTINVSSNYINSLIIPTGSFTWTIELYYDNNFYNTYKGNWSLYHNGEIQQASYREPVESKAVLDSYLEIEEIIFRVNSSSNMGFFEIHVNKTSNLDVNGDIIQPQNIKLVIDVFDNLYPTQLNSVVNNKIIYVTEQISLLNFEVDTPTDWQVTMLYNDNMYNEYNGSINILTTGRRKVNDIINDKPAIISEPAIELVHLGLNEITVIKVEDNYVFFFKVNKMPKNNSNSITCKLLIENTLLELSEDVTNYSGETSEEEQNNEETEQKNSASTVLFMSSPIPSTNFSSGLVTFKVELLYNNISYAVYKQNAIFHYDMTEIIHSNISRHPVTGYKYIWGVPVIEKKYYDDNINYLDQYVFNKLADLCHNFKKYKMLTDKTNLKFARTFGKIKNIQLNTYNTLSTKTYDLNYDINVIPDINVKVYIKKTSKNNIPSVVEECKNVIYTFLQLKANIHTNIYRSELSRFLHDTVDDLEFCEVLEPTDDIIFDFNLETIPKSQRVIIYEYCPEFIWFQKDKINIQVALM